MEARSRKEIFDDAVKNIGFKPGQTILWFELAYGKPENPKNYYLETCSLVSKRDLRFERDAHLMPHSKIVAAEGPQFDELEKYLLDTAFNQHHPIEHIIAMGFGKFCYFEAEEITVNPKCTLPSDFINYAALNFAQEELEVSSFEVKAKLLRSTVFPFKKDIPTKAHEIKLDVKHSKYPEQTKTVTITNFQLPDGEHFDTTFDDDKHSLKNLLWNTFLTTLQKNTLVHCRAGLGRTGHIIYLFDTLKMLINGQLNETDPEKIAAILKARLKAMRKLRPAFVLGEEQFQFAIRNAVDVYEYALQNKLITAEVLALCKSQQAEIEIKPSKRKEEPTPDPTLRFTREPATASSNGFFSCKKIATTALACATLAAGVLVVNACSHKI